MMTESDRLARALESAAELWPDAQEEKGVLLRRILDAGIVAIEEAKDKRISSRLGAITRSAGCVTGIWPATWREELRGEWPA
jgi:hypothetical protein